MTEYNTYIFQLPNSQFSWKAKPFSLYIFAVCLIWPFRYSYCMENKFIYCCHSESCWLSYGSICFIIVGSMWSKLLQIVNMLTKSEINLFDEPLIMNTLFKPFITTQKSMNYFKYQKQPPEVLYKKRCSTYNFIKKETQTQMFFLEFCEIFKKSFFTEHVCVTASEAWADELIAPHHQPLHEQINEFIYRVN